MSSPSTSSIQTEMSSTINTKETQPSHGSLTEIFKQNCAALFLMDYDDDQSLRFLRHGEFVVKLIMQASSPVLMVTCAVDELQWPITKDAPVIRIGKRSFAFAMPGILYGLQFSSVCSEEMIDTLERVFMKFAYYKDLNEGEAGYPYIDTEPDFWFKLSAKIESIAYTILTQFSHTPGKSPSAIGNQASGLLRAVRTSASTKMVGNAILCGALKATHIDIQDLRPVHKFGDESIISQQAFPSICVFGNLVEAVEVAWVVESGDSHLLKEKVHRNVKDLVGFKMWRLNEKGLVVFMEKLVGQ